MSAVPPGFRPLPSLSIPPEPNSTETPSNLEVIGPICGGAMGVDPAQDLSLWPEESVRRKYLKKGLDQSQQLASFLRSGRKRDHLSSPCLHVAQVSTSCSSSMVVEPMDLALPLDLKSDFPSEEPLKRKPGRPRKHIAETNLKSQEDVIKRKRGRPRKDESGPILNIGENQSQLTPFLNPCKRRVGRPRKHFSESGLNIATVKLGPPQEDKEYWVPIEVPSSPEPSDTEIGPLLMLQPFPKPQPGNHLLPEELEQSLNIAEGVKSFLVSRLTSMIDNKFSGVSDTHRTYCGTASDVNTMIAAANDAFRTLNFLYNDYKSFHSDICELIGCNIELLVTGEERNNLPGLTAHYKELVNRSKDAEQALLNTERHLKLAREKQIPLTERTANAREVLRKLEGMLAASVVEVEWLEAERDRLSKAILVTGAEMQKYHSLSEKAEMNLPDIQRRQDEAKAGIERIRSKYSIMK